MVEIPDVVGKPKDAAAQMLEDSGLVVGAIRHEQRTDKPKDTVLEEFPPKGEKVKPGSQVNLTLSIAAEMLPKLSQTVQVPNLIGKPKFDAQSELNSAGLSLGTITEQENGNLPPGQVLKQFPPPGEQVNKGSQVDLMIEAAPTAPLTAQVPNVTKMPSESERPADKTTKPTERMLVLDYVHQKHNGTAGGSTITWRFDVFVNGSLAARIPEHAFAPDMKDVPVNQDGGIAWPSVSLPSGAGSKDRN